MKCPEQKAQAPPHGQARALSFLAQDRECAEFRAPLNSTTVQRPPQHAKVIRRDGWWADCPACVFRMTGYSALPFASMMPATGSAWSATTSVLPACG